MMAKLREDKPKKDKPVDDDKVSVDFYVEVPKRLLMIMIYYANNTHTIIKISCSLFIRVWVEV